VSISPAPVIATDVPPAVQPEVGVIEMITGAGWNPQLIELFVPPGVEILIGTVPARCARVTASSSVLLTSVKLEAGVLLNFTLVVPVKSVPVIVTLLLPASTPVVGNTAVGAGAAIYV
jgi:hypothetical protein